MTVWGIDISNHQAGADLAKAKAAGASFVFAKATEGLTFDDDHFAGFRAQAAKIGLPFAAYHFGRPQTGRTGAQEAAHFLRIYKRAPGDLAPILDLESNGVESPAGSGRWVNQLSKAALTQFVQDFLVAVEKATGVTPWIYTGSWFWADEVTPLSAFARYPLWLANYRSTPPPPPAPWKAWTVWQHTSTATVPGIPGNCDRNIAAAGFPATTQEDDMTPDQAATLDRTKSLAESNSIRLQTQVLPAIKALGDALGPTVKAAVDAAVDAALTPQAVADAIPDNLAQQVVDLLGARLNATK